MLPQTMDVGGPQSLNPLQIPQMSRRTRPVWMGTKTSCTHRRRSFWRISQGLPPVLSAFAARRPTAWPGGGSGRRFCGSATAAPHRGGWATKRSPPPGTPLPAGLQRKTGAAPHPRSPEAREAPPEGPGNFLRNLPETVRKWRPEALMAQRRSNFTVATASIKPYAVANKKILECLKPDVLSRSSIIEALPDEAHPGSFRRRRFSGKMCEEGAGEVGGG